ncbi:MAG: glycosyltransferase family 39 protein [Candidatus Krumholzibacteriota bacterium]|nr:glycosyltransferase family 39 protein [Candidatus Krumholzibacteriota bacterium]
MKELPFLAGEDSRGSFLLFLFFLSALVVTGWGIWEGTLPATGEAVFAEQAREAAGGNLWPARFDGEAVPGTPPLPLWTAAASIRLLGASGWAVRLPFVFLALAAVAFVRAAAAAAAADDRSAAGLLAALLLVASPFFGRYAPHASPEVFLALSVALALLGLLRLPAPDGAWEWGAGVACAVFSAGAAGLFLLPAGLAALAADQGRRAAFGRPAFLVATAGALAAGLAWSAGAGGGLGGFPLVAAGDAVRDAWRAWAASLPWSILAAAAAIRTCLPRAAGGTAGADRLLLVFAALLAIFFGLAGGARAERFLAAAPPAAIMAAREAARLLAARRKTGQGGSERLRSLDRVLVMVLLFLMMLIVITPLDLHRRVDDQIDEIAGMTARLLPAGGSVANFRQPGEIGAARLLFYGGRSLDRRAIETPDDLARAIEREPGRLWLTTMRDMADLRRKPGFPVALAMVYRAGDWVLFTEERGGER